jgi:hypothetical protein
LLRRILLFVALFLATSCSSVPPFHALRMAALRPGGHTWPVIRAKVDGETVLLIVDTGSTDNILTPQFAQKHELTALGSSTAQRVVDAHGNVRQLAFIPGVSVQFEGEQTPIRLDFLRNVSSLAPEVAGIIAPQELVRSGWALVIDVGGEELEYKAEEKVLAAWASAAVHGTPVDFHGCLREGFFEKGHRIVSVMINGVKVNMLLDTGAAGTVLFRDNPALTSMLAQVGSRRTSAALVSTSQSLVLDDVEITFAGTSLKLPVAVGPGQDVCFDGLLGADFLRHCELVWGASDLWATCQEQLREP